MCLINHFENISIYFTTQDENKKIGKKMKQKVIERMNVLVNVLMTGHKNWLDIPQINFLFLLVIQVNF